jgi:hypothetical protein
MGNNNLKETENLSIILDENNILCVDPNSVINEQNLAEPRHVRPENLVMYVNLEADLVPRSVLVSDKNPATGKLQTIAGGTLNFLKNQNNSNGDFDTSWTDYFNPTKSTSEIIMTNTNGNISLFEVDLPAKEDDPSGQSFGIESININVTSIGLPKVTINFIDVRGKTLLSGEKNSPYASFFHLPWPIFYLTVKGYYGKAIKYRLHMTSFTSKFNDSNGNFEVTSSFVGQLYAFLAEIPLNGILAAPYLYYIETEKDVQTNTKNNVVEKRISKSSKGYQLLNSVYDEYKAKGLIDKNFKTITLRELITKAKSLDKILEKELFSNAVDFKIVGSLNELETNIKNYYDSIVYWITRYVSSDYYPNKKLKYLSSQDKTSTENLLDPKKTGTLESFLSFYNEQITKIKTYIDNHSKESNNEIYKKISLDIPTTLNDVNSYYEVAPDGTKDILFNDVLILSDIQKMRQSFTSQKDKIYGEITTKMNDIIKDPNKGIGFNPTIKNVFAVVLANAEVFIKFLKDVHVKAFEVGEIRRSKLTKQYCNETPDINGGNIYPWPKVVKPSNDGTLSVLAYPGESELVEILGSNDKTLWPEVDFIENYIGIVTKRVDTLADKEGGVGQVNMVFVDNNDKVNVRPTATILDMNYDTTPYSNKTISSTIYEIYERSRYITLYNTNDNQTILELADLEFENIQKCLSEDFDLIEILKKVSNQTKLHDYLKAFSELERYPYYLDRYPTVDYIKKNIDSPFIIEQTFPENILPNFDSVYPKFSKDISNYVSEKYRLSLYPYNSEDYFNRINKTNFNIDELTFQNIFSVDSTKYLITSPQVIPTDWVKKEYQDNIFSRPIKFGNTSVNILNTPYFHNQLYSDFTKNLNVPHNVPTSKYAGSAYLLLNSLPFYELSDEIDFPYNGKTRLSNMFREMSSSHRIPYHLLLKWGSIYHRYKKHTLDNEDILLSFEDEINRNIFFKGPDNNFIETLFFNQWTDDRNKNVKFQNVRLFPSDYTGSTITSKESGINPFYEAVFSQIVNGYTHYDTMSLTGSTSYSGRTDLTTGSTKTFIKNYKNHDYYTTYFDNSVMYTNNTYYTLLPTTGGLNEDFLDTKYTTINQSNFRILWYEETKINEDDVFSNYSVTSSNYYFNYNLDNFENYTKMYDLISTFPINVLEEFEKLFLEFSSEKENVETPLYSFPIKFDSVNTEYKIEYQNFQTLLKDLVSITKNKDDDFNTPYKFVQTLIDKQKVQVQNVSDLILGLNNFVTLTLANPRELDLSTLESFTEINQDTSITYNPFDNSQITTGSTGTIEFLKIYLGEEPTTDCYLNFFKNNDIELSIDNIINFRHLIYIYAGGVKDGLFNNSQTFKQYVVDNIVDPFRVRQSNFLNQIITKLNSFEFKGKENKPNALIESGFNNNTVKLELYNTFKSFNDKWAAGNSMGQHTLLEDFLFLDRANQDIGDKAYIDITKLIQLESPNNDSADLFSVCNMLIEGEGFDMRPMPAYVNFYGTNYGKNPKLTPSQRAANDIFGTFLEVDYEDASPKVVIQYINETSKNPDMGGISDKYYFNNDSFNIGQRTPNPLFITNPDKYTIENLKKSNRVVAFEVGVGDQNQGLFKGIQVSQDTIKNTTESFRVFENIGRSATGAAAAQIDTNLYDVYKQASYSCEITMMGDVMIQPTMYFYLKNIPIFTGTYWITDVSHSIKGSKMTTTFKGTRIPTNALPDFKDSFTSSYKSLFDSIITQGTNQFKQDINPQPTTEQSVSTPTNSATVDQGTKPSPPGETLISEINTTNYGIPYNGYKGEKYIQYITDKFGDKWLKTKAVVMGSTEYQINNEIEMQILNRSNRNILSSLDLNQNSIGHGKKITWSNLKNSKGYFYSTRFDLNKITAENIMKLETHMKNPYDGKNTFVIMTSPLIIDISKDINGPINVGPASSEYGIGLSYQLAKDLKINNGDFVYFKLL